MVTIQQNIASVGPAGGQTFETFDKQVFIHNFRFTSNERRMWFDPRNEGQCATATCFQGILPNVASPPLPPEAFFHVRRESDEFIGCGWDSPV